MAGFQVARQSARHAHAQQEAVDVGYACVGRIVAQRQPGLHAGGALREPTDVAGRVALADEAVQGVRIGQSRAGKFVFDAVQELPHLAQAATPGDARARTIGADEVTRMADALHLPTVVAALRIGEGAAQAQFDAVPTHLSGEPAHHRRCVGGQEVVARRGQRHLPEAGRVQAHLFDPPGHRRGHLVEQGLLGGFLDDDPGGAQLVAGIALALEHAHPQAPLRCGDGAGRTGEAGADDDHVEVESPCCVVHGAPGRCHGGNGAAMVRGGDGGNVKWD